jgi:hypothetical protein
VLGARRSVVTVEEVVPDLGRRSRNAVILPHWVITALAVAEGGARPSYAHGYYARDNAFYKAWDGISRDRKGFLAAAGRASPLEAGVPYALFCDLLEPLLRRETADSLAARAPPAPASPPRPPAQAPPPPRPGGPRGGI